MISPRVLGVVALVVGFASALLAGAFAGVVYAFAWNITDDLVTNTMVALLVASALLGAAGSLAAPFRPGPARWPLVVAAALVLPTMPLSGEWAPGTPALGFAAAALLCTMATRRAEASDAS